MPSIVPRFRPRLLACAALLLSLSAPALAQRVVEGDLQQQMSPAEFKAAGLDKLLQMGSCETPLAPLPASLL